MAGISVDAFDFSFVDQAWRYGVAAMGFGTPQDQIVAWFIIGAFVIVTSSIGLVATILLLPIVALGLAVGVIRLLWWMYRG